MYCSVAGDRLPLIRKHQEMSQVVFRINLFTTSLCSLAILNCVLQPSGCLFITKCKDTEDDSVYRAFSLIFFSSILLILFSL